MSTQITTPVPTRRWQDLAGLGDLDGPADTAERLLLLLHYGIDWEGWVGRYRATYWEGLLADRVVVAAYRSRSLGRWWDDVATELGASPRTAAQRRELAQLVSQDGPPVLQVMREESEALLLRVRIIADAVRSARLEEAAAREENAA